MNPVFVGSSTPLAMLVVFACNASFVYLCYEVYRRFVSKQRTAEGSTVDLGLGERLRSWSVYRRLRWRKPAAGDAAPAVEEPLLAYTAPRA